MLRWGEHVSRLADIPLEDHSANSWDALGRMAAAAAEHPALVAEAAFVAVREEEFLERPSG